MDYWKKIKMKKGLPCDTCALRTKESMLSCHAYHPKEIPKDIIKTDKFCIFYMPQKGDSTTSKEKNIEMIFCQRELCGFFSLLCLQIVCIGYLIWWAGEYTKWYLMWLFGVLMLSLFCFFKTLWKFRYEYDNLYREQQEWLIGEFKSPHPIYKLFLGEIHLLSHCLVSRCLGNWQIIFFDEVEMMDTIQYTQSYGLFRNLRLHMNDLKKYEFTFFGKHKQESKFVMAWIKLKNPQIKIKS